MKQTIPKKIRQLVWNTHIGEDIGRHQCMCCRATYITQMNFQCGHIISEYNGGTCTINNLVPICSLCNTSMGRTNMDIFMMQHGLDVSGIKKIMNNKKTKIKRDKRDDDNTKTIWQNIKELFGLSKKT